MVDQAITRQRHSETGTVELPANPFPLDVCSILIGVAQAATRVDITQEREPEPVPSEAELVEARRVAARA